MFLPTAIAHSVANGYVDGGDVGNSGVPSAERPSHDKSGRQYRHEDSRSRPKDVYNSVALSRNQRSWFELPFSDLELPSPLMFSRWRLHLGDWDSDGAVVYWLRRKPYDSSRTCRTSWVPAGCFVLLCYATFCCSNRSALAAASSAEKAR
ncbi:hypothetical protein GY45DRAFT_1325928 [Cubamyces sp. BRFM 1775]|nr:hypothetical protein GY45DRAFT_1325928 [Cubamyces sp. BRFM 1775]